jgi:predicted molibdopterin-dependent oxidoreductase YjgC
MPVDGMTLDAECDEVQQTRAMSLELLLSDHRADCEAPCTLVCPNGLDVEQTLACYDNGDYAAAYSLINNAFALPEIKCTTCKAPCEKACRRGTVDKPVSIREIIEEICSQQYPNNNETTNNQIVKPSFLSRLGRFTDEEKEHLKASVTTTSRCLHCACAGQQGCKLRLYAAETGVKRPRYEVSSAVRVMQKQTIADDLWFEPAKCIRCGLCVYNTDNGFTFKGRGFNMQVVLPHDNAANIPFSIAELCPTGAIYKS